jgi:predicted nucleotidyltransferase
VTDLEAALRRVTADLDERGIRWALVGGLAVGTRAEPRTTRDIDLAVAVQNDRQAEHLVGELRAIDYELRAIVEHDGLGRLATARLIAPGKRVVVDLLFSSSGIEESVVREAERMEIIEGLEVLVARTGHLIALKLLARDDRHRPQDYDDLLALKARASEADWQLAELAVAAIMGTGAARGRDLAQLLDQLRSAE